MDGLECSEVPFSNLNLGDRFDAEYFTKKYLNISKALETVATRKLGEVSKAIASAFYPPATQLYSIGDTPFVRCVDCINYPIITGEQEDIFEKIPYSFGKNNKGISFLKNGEIVITKVGTPCYASIIEDYEEVALSRTVMGLSNIREIDPYYLVVFLRSKYGFEQLYRQRELTIQYQLTLPRIKAIDVFMASCEYQMKIREICAQYRTQLSLSRKKYDDATDILISALNYCPIKQTESIVTKSFSESFVVTGRLDAEYYQPKYDDVRHALNTTDTVRSLCVLHDRNFIPDWQKEYVYIELADVGRNGEITKIEPTLGAKLPTRARRMVNSGQVIISSIEGSLQSCALVTDDFNGALCSTGFYVLTSNSINPETLLVLFKSEPMQLLMKQRCSGTIMSAISKDELLNLPLPKVDGAVQAIIANKVQESFAMRRKAERMIQAAVKSVEIAIEQNETSAIDYLSESMLE